MNDPTLSIPQHLVEEFGANATYVQSLLERYLANPTSIDESWRAYFADVLGSRNGESKQLVGETPIAPAQAVQNESVAAISPVPDGVAGAELMAGGAKKVVQNMEESLQVPTATSVRLVPVKLLEENRKLINQFLDEQNASSSVQISKVSFTHLIAWALVRALEKMPQMNDGFVLSKGLPARLKRSEINLGIAIDLQRKDGTRTLLVPNIKAANRLSFAEFHRNYDDIVSRSRTGKIDLKDFEGTTISLTNPGTIGTVGSVPRLMSGQSLILATGAIEYPAEYQAMSPEIIAQLGIGKVVQISSTYDHRIIQGAESGALLQRMHELLLGKDEFYEHIFTDLSIPYKPLVWSVDQNKGAFGGDGTREQMSKQARVLELINSYRVRGHLIANIDPLHAMPLHYHPDLEMEKYGLTIWDLDREFITGGFGGVESLTLRKILELLRRSYCGTVGVEYRHLQSKEEKVWLRARIERDAIPVPTEIRKQILWKLISAEQFERFLHNNFLGQKRFSVEGCETVIPLLDQLIEGSVARGVQDIVLGMSHRGRLNVLANVLGHFCERIFASFIGSVHPDFPADEGDVKYHQGASATRETNGKTIHLKLSPNPSHLEFVDAVVEGMARAMQDERLPVSHPRHHQTEERIPAWNEILPVLLHGDAAFAGQGIVMETLNLYDLKGYRTGGTIHIIVNNQIGFTTGPEAGRSTIYSTDVARMTQLPIFHINGDDPDAAYRTLQIALDFRQQFHKDVVLDVVGFRRLGHNESDEPSYTQPLMYQRVKAHPGVREIYSKKLIKQGVVTEQEVQSLIEERVHKYDDALVRAKELIAEQPANAVLPPPSIDEDGSTIIETGISHEVVRRITDKISLVPNEFHINPKMVVQLARRAKMGEGSLNADWAFAEALAFGSLVLDGTPVRLSGQDSGRGTFSQRHAILYDIQSGAPWTPLALLASDSVGESTARFDVFDSSLSEQGVLGFEYGYSVIAEETLTIWEAQFGDFANGAQVIIDQFIVSGEDKWQQRSRVTLLLPHGYEGQGPEHSSARLERFLQLCGQNNIQVINPTTPAQYFHLLRRQMKQEVSRPLIVMTPKSLLRLAAASSPVGDLTRGGFLPVLDDSLNREKSAIDRIVICSGKLFYDLLEAREKANKLNVALLRLEQLYPFPKKLLSEILATYPNAKKVIWAQEEPKNMGGWAFVKPRLSLTIPESVGEIEYVGRARSASPSTGFYAVHKMEQEQIVKDALG